MKRWARVVVVGGSVTWLASACSSGELDVSSLGAASGARVSSAASSPGMVATETGVARRDVRVGLPADAGILGPQQTRAFAWGLRTKLASDETTTEDRFGAAVGISGDNAVVGAWTGKAPSGAAYVFHRSGAEWAKSADLLPSDPTSAGAFGFGVAMSGTTAVVSDAMGALYVFTQSGQAWTQTAKFAVPALQSVAIDGNTIIVGSIGNAVTPGVAYVFGLSGGIWSQVATLSGNPSVGDDSFGLAVAVSGDTAVVGAYNKAYAFARSGGTWSQAVPLVPNDIAPGDGLGAAVALDGDTAVVGAWLQNGRRGGAYVFSHTGTTWNQTAKLVASDAAANDSFGVSVAVKGNLALVGANASTSSRGAAYLFTQANGTWSQTNRWGGDKNEQLGKSVAMDDGAAILGAPFSAVGPGSAYVFDNLRHANGDACAAVAECASGFCVDGVCCDTACNGTCQACTATKKGAGADGTCAAIAAGTDPDAECTAATCSGSTLSTATGCSGTSAACAAPVTSSCAPFACNASGTACATLCTVDTDCVSDSFCKAGTCAVKRANGAACSNTKECSSGQCADGVCCDTACSGTCQACLFFATGQADGTCASVVDGRDPRQDCSSLGTSCASGTVTSHVCNGSGACRNETASCSPYACTADGKGCATSCATDYDCASNQFCDSTHVCTTKHLAGASCSTASECGTGFCVDDVCCGSACDGQCEACTEPGSVGTCIPVRGAPRAGHPACVGTASECGGTCDGVNPSSCTFSSCDAASADPTSPSPSPSPSTSASPMPSFYAGGGGGCSVEATHESSGTSAPLFAAVTLGLAIASRRRRRD